MHSQISQEALRIDDSVAIGEPLLPQFDPPEARSEEGLAAAHIIHQAEAAVDVLALEL
jgi:hypothetical protein